MNRLAATARINATRRARAAFTLTELVVAVGAAAILTASVGILFRSVGDLASNGVAAAELDQVARVIERQLRDDISAFNRLPASETFLAIRFREIGDIDRSGAVDQSVGERAIYLSEADRSADLTDFPAVADASRPYTGDGARPGRGVTTRLDEMIFLGRGIFASAQGSAAVSGHARIYWGHGQRPLPDPNPDLQPDPVTRLVPASRRMYSPDGDFGMRRGETFRYLEGANLVTYTSTGRNEYATDWALARQAALLYGGSAISNSNRPFSSPLPDELTFAPLIRDQENQERFGSNQGAWTIPLYGLSPDRVDYQFPDPRYLGGGRTDIVAQSFNDVRRWLEGDPPATLGTPNVALPFGEGLLSDPAAFENTPLWVRAPANRDFNLMVSQAAIAGAFIRPLLDDRPPQITQRRFDFSAANQAFREPPETALMDLHALVATRCSRFEIAWNDGTIAISELDVNNDGLADFFPGDRIWFDITPILDDRGQIIRRNTYADWLRWARANPRSVRFARLDSDIPEVINPDIIGATTAAGSSPTVRLLDSRWYDPAYTGGSLIASTGAFGPEAYAIWGFRTPLANGDYGPAWPKPTLIRVRMTLHDSQLRSTEGRTYEFVYSLSNAR